VAHLPDWIDDRIGRNVGNSLTQRHVVETMLDSERPFFSIRQIESRVKPDVSKATVRNRLNELQELDVIATEAYPESVTLYYVDYPESNWPLPPQEHRTFTGVSPLDQLSVRGFITMRETAGVRTLVLAGYQFTLVLLALGTVLSAFGPTFGSGNGVPLWGTAFDLLVVTTALLLTERAVAWVRSRYAPFDSLPSV